MWKESCYLGLELWAVCRLQFHLLWVLFNLPMCLVESVDCPFSPLRVCLDVFLPFLPIGLRISTLQICSWCVIVLYRLGVQSPLSTLESICVDLDPLSSPFLVLEQNSDLPFWSLSGSLYFWHHVIVSHLMKTPFCVLWINLYYMKLSTKQVIHVAPMSIFLTLNQMVATLTTVTDKSDLHKGRTINLK